MPIEERKLRDLVSIGPAMLRDFELLGVASVAQLSRRNPEKLYEKLCQIKGQTARHLLSGCFSRGRGAGAESAFAGGAMPMVVLEPQTKGTRWRPLRSVR